MKTEKEMSGNYGVNVLTSLKDTAGAYTEVEVTLQPKEGNELHYHTTFTEYFETVSGVLSVQVGKEIKRLAPGSSYTVDCLVPHRFFNESSAPTVFRCVIKPARSFEKVLLIGNGLKRDGKTRVNGLPKDLWHLIVLLNLSETYFCGIPLWLQRLVFGALGRIAKWKGIDRQLMKYWDEVTPTTVRTPQPI